MRKTLGIRQVIDSDEIQIALSLHNNSCYSPSDSAESVNCNLCCHLQISFTIKFEGFKLSSNYKRIEHEINSKPHHQLKELDCTKRDNLNDLEVYGRNRADLEAVKSETINIFSTGDKKNG